MQPMTAYQEKGREIGLALACVVGAAAAFVAISWIAASRNGWAFEYPLDDVYIHLAMAEQIAAGGYGVNPGEYASAASSPIYPFLLTPFSGSGGQRWLPILWNVAALLGAAWLFGVALARAGLGRFGILVAAIAPLALSMYMTAFTGMENMLHVAASLAIVLGLWRFVETGTVGALLILGVASAPAIRLEGLGLSLVASALVMLLGNWRAGVGLFVLALLPVAVFAAALASFGLDPLPNSVVAKLSDTGGAGLLGKLGVNSHTYGGRFLLILSACVLLLGATELRRNRRKGYFALAIAASGFAHLMFGSTGWMDRYETYATVSQVAALALMLGTVSSFLRTAAILAALVGGLFTYGPYALSIYAWNPKAIAAQHGEMARFAKVYLKAPVAVNDIGYVAWQNPNYVLDLWGLASPEALALRLSDGSAGWAGPLAEEKDVRLAMVYDKWLSDAVPATWVRLGVLHLEVPTAFLGDRAVTFYATNPSEATDLRALLKDWEESLPDMAWFEPSEERK